ncbi:MAG: DivIVA domain-containing protein [Gemmatimonadales bacterium]|nr:MAG: DivIVA domain-containing protein [Gemmatimonadales bacterium]
MIDLTPLDVRNKRGDFRKAMRGYDPQEVDHFLEMVAERLDEVVKQNLTLSERVDRLSEQLSGQEGRERAVQEALVTAQSLREEIESQAHREAELTRREAEDDAERIRDAAERAIHDRQHELDDLNRSRRRFLRAFRSLLEEQLDVVRVEEERPILEDLDLDALRVFQRREPVDAGESDEAAEAEPADEDLPEPEASDPDAPDDDTESDPTFQS